MRIGAQLYTVREFCRTLTDLERTLEKIAEIGYTAVQMSGTCDYEAAWLRERLSLSGLDCALTHIPPQRLRAETEQVIRDHETLGCPYVGLGYWAFDDEKGMDFDDFMKIWPPVARCIRAGGRYFMFHNHDREFIPLRGKPLLWHLAERIPPEDMGFTLDTYWVRSGGGDPEWWISFLSGRVPCLHLKDYAGGGRMAALGEGEMDFDRILRAAEGAGTEYLLVEQDDCGGEDPFSCLRRSYLYLKARGLR